MPGSRRGVGIFDVASGQELLSLPSSTLVSSLAFSPDGTRLYMTSQRGLDGVHGMTFEITGPFLR